MSRPTDLVTAARILALGAFVIVAASLVAGVGSIEPSALPSSSGTIAPSPPTVVPPHVSAATGQGSPDLVLWSLGAIVVALAVMSVRRRRMGSRGHLFWQTVGGLAGVAAYFFISYVIVTLPQPSVGVQQLQAITLAAAMLAAILGVGSVMVYQTLKERGRALRAASMRPENPVRAAEELVARLRTRIYSDRGGGADRESVIACYSAMTRMLEAHGAPDRPSLTPRELRLMAGDALDIRGESIDDLTRLFEKARYDDLPVTREDALESVAALERLTGELEEAS